MRQKGKSEGLGRVSWVLKWLPGAWNGGFGHHDRPPGFHAQTGPWQGQLLQKNVWDPIATGECTADELAEPLAKLALLHISPLRPTRWAMALNSGLRLNGSELVRSETGPVDGLPAGLVKILDGMLAASRTKHARYGLAGQVSGIGKNRCHHLIAMESQVSTARAGNQNERRSLAAVRAMGFQCPGVFSDSHGFMVSENGNSELPPKLPERICVEPTWTAPRIRGDCRRGPW